MNLFDNPLIDSQNMTELKEKLEKASLSIKSKNLKLNALLEITIAINNNFSRDQLFKIYEFVLKNQLKIGRVALFSDSDNLDWASALNYDSLGKAYSINVERDLLPIKEITEIKTVSNVSLNAYDYIIPVFHKSRPLAYLLVGDIENESFGHSDSMLIPFLQTLTNVIVVAIENKNLYKENIRQAKIKKELELASEMQAMLIPHSLPKNAKIEMGAFYQPHQEVGGDYYDYIKLNDNEFVFCVADVSGKGVSAALLMSNFQANLRTLFSYPNMLPSVVEELNTRVNASAKGEKFITLFIAKYNIQTRTLSYINAGHNPPILLHDSNKVTYLKTGCTGLGMFDRLPHVEKGMINIPQNAVLLCYTDGAVELLNDQGEEFGTSKLTQLLARNSNLSIENINKNITESLEKYRGRQPYVDDIALFTCRFF